MHVFRSILLLFVLFLFGCLSNSKQTNLSTQDVGYDYFIPPVVELVNIDHVEPELMDTLCTYLSSSFAFCSTTESKPYPMGRKHKDLHVDTVLAYLQNIKSPHATFVIGITTRKIYSTENGKRKKKQLLGHARLGGKVSVVSTYDISRKNPLAFNYKNRVIKIMVHELGHNLGLEHCISIDQCIMHEQAGSAQQLDRMEMIFCESCRRRLFTESRFALFY